MMIRTILFGMCASAALSTDWSVFAAVEEDDAVEIIETKIKFSDCPIAVQKTLQLEAVGATLNEVVKASDDDTTVFKGAVTLDERDYEVIVDEDGTLLAKALIYENAITIEINLIDCPAVVQKTLKRESRGAEIESVDKVATEDKLYYVADVKIESKTYEIIVGEDGILESKLLHEEVEEENTTEGEVKKI
jgi:hypothetical protein